MVSTTLRDKKTVLGVSRKYESVNEELSYAANRYWNMVLLELILR